MEDNFSSGVYDMSAGQYESKMVNYFAFQKLWDPSLR